MPVVDYSKTLIYKIQHESKDELLYIGSTTHFGNRKVQHKSRCYNPSEKSYNTKLYSTIRENGGWDAFNMVIVKEFPCENKRQAQAEEDKVIREMKSSLNMVRAYTTEEEKKKLRKEYDEQNRDKIKETYKNYCELNKDKLKETHKKYYEQNRDKLKETHKKYYEQNRDKIKEYRKEYCEQNKDKIKETHNKYYEQNRDKINEQKKEYRAQNIDKIKEYNEQNKEKRKEYREQHRDKIKEYQKEYRVKYWNENKTKLLEQKKEYRAQNRERLCEKHTCPCGGIYTHQHKSSHLKTKKHQAFINQQTDQ